jgi:short-subunit dehydrogenase
MNDLVKRYGSWAFVAGAAEGIGEAYSMALAGRGFNLILLDNREESLERINSRIKSEHGVETETLALDLGTYDASAKILTILSGVGCRFMVYVAAYSKVKRFTENSREELDAYVDVNMRTPMHLFHGFIKYLEGKGPGGIIIMSSLGSLWGTKLLIPYGATKAFDLVLAESLHYELKDENIDVMACVAGATTTPTYLASKPKYGAVKPPLQKPGQVAESALRKFGKKAVHISGWQNKMSYFLMSRVFSRQGAARMFNRTVTKMFADKL